VTTGAPVTTSATTSAINRGTTGVSICDVADADDPVHVQDRNGQVAETWHVEDSPPWPQPGGLQS
jgi:hypothetical protein